MTDETQRDIPPPEPPPQGGAPQPEPAPQEPPPFDFDKVMGGEGGDAEKKWTQEERRAMGRSLVAFTDFIMVGTVGVYAKLQGCFTPPEVSELSAKARLSDDERTTLGMIAPFAAPFFLRVLAHLDKVAAIAYVGVFAMSAASRMSAIKNVARERKAAKEAAAKTPEKANVQPIGGAAGAKKERKKKGGKL